MKTPCLILLIPTTIILIFAFQKTFSQNKGGKTKIYIARIVTENNKQVKGILYAVNDSAVILYTENTIVSKDSLLNDSIPLKIYSYRDIHIIKVRRRGAVIEGALIGGASGIASGLLTDEMIRGIRNAGNIVGSPIIGNREDVGYMPAFTITFGLIGLGIGILDGASSKKYEIKGNKIIFTEKENDLFRYCLKKKS